MYKINTSTNTIEKLSKQTFTELGFKERQNLQEWIDKEPTCLGEDLLIIQKEFDGFDDTKERLDLLAIDKNGGLVIIENKLDDTGRDVVWQAIKYASYCSSLTKEQIVEIYQNYLDKKSISKLNATEKIVEFFNDKDFEDIRLNERDQRIIFIAANFRKEITSAVMWLINHRINVQCYKTTPYKFGDEIFLSIEQIIPTKEAEEYMIKMATKEQEEHSSIKSQQTRHVLRLEFWKRLLEAMSNSGTNLFSGITPTDNHWIQAGSGMRSCPYIFVFSRKFGRVELYIDRGERNENNYIFDELLKNKTTIESNFGDELTWERLEERRACRIKYEKPFDGYNKDSWDEMISFLISTMVKFENTMKPFIAELNKKLQNEKRNIL